MTNRERQDSLINKLDEFAWKRMKPEERLVLLQEFEDFLAASTGRGACEIRVIPDDVLKSQESPGTVLHGYYSPSEQCIYINPKYLTSRITAPGISMFHFGAVLTTIAHEGRHAWQHFVVDHPEKELISRRERLALWMNFPAYRNGDNSSHTMYEAQLLEFDARHFAVSVIKNLARQIEKKEGHAGYLLERSIRENEKHEKLLAEKIFSELNETELRVFEEKIRKVLAEKTPGIDWSGVSIFEAAIKLLNSKDIREFIDASGIQIRGSMPFEEGTEKSISVSKVSELAVNAALIKVKRQKSVTSFVDRRKRI